MFALTAAFATPSSAAGILDNDVLGALQRLDESGGQAQELGQRDRALLFMHNDDINAAALTGEISEQTYQRAQGDFAELNREFAANAAHAAHADFTVQQRTSQVFSPGTDSDYITVVVESADQIDTMKGAYNDQINAFLESQKVLTAPRTDWTNKLDTDFMADPRFVKSEAQFQEIARRNNDAYSRRHSAEFERIIRDPDGPKRFDPWHVVAYTQEMDDFAYKKRRHLDEVFANPSAFGDASVRADAFRTMAQEQKYISRIEMAEDLLRQQEHLVPRDRGPQGSIASLGSVRRYANRETIVAAYQVSDQSLSNAIANMIDTMAEVSKTNDMFADRAVGDISTLIVRLPEDQRRTVLDRLRASGSGDLADQVAKILRTRNPPDPTESPPGGKPALPPPNDDDFDRTVLALPPSPSPPEIEEQSLALPDNSEYAGMYIATAQGMARERLALPPSIEDGFVLPEVEDVSAELERERAPLWDRLKGEIGGRLGGLAADLDIERVNRAVDEHKIREEQAIRAAYAGFVAAMPAEAQGSLISAEKFYDDHAADIKKMDATLAKLRLLSTAARAYYDKGARGIVEVAFRVGCTSLMQTGTNLAAGASSLELGPAGYYVAQAVGAKLGQQVCDRFITFLFTPRYGESWLTGVIVTPEVVYSRDPVVNEWVKILYTGEIMSGVDRPDLAPGLDFFFRERVNNPREILRHFPSQPELHAALQHHWHTLYLEHPELQEYLDVANSETARKIWERIYQVAGETLAQAIGEKMEAEPKPVAEGTSILEYFRQGQITWPPPANLHPAPSVIRAAAADLGMLEPGSRHEVVARLGILGLAGLDEQLTVSWEIEGPGIGGTVVEEDSIAIPFARDATNPVTDLFKVAKAGFDLRIDPERFVAGNDYALVARVEGTSETLRYPFTVAPSEVHFVVSIEGEGYAAQYDYGAEGRVVDPDGTVWITAGAYVGRKVAGSHEMWMTLKAGEDHDRAKESLRRYILSGICRTRFIKGGGAAGPPSDTAETPRGWVPIVWQNGPRIETVAGPFASRDDYQQNLSRSWREKVDEQGPEGSYVLMSDLVDKVKNLDDCGGPCCAVSCTDPFHCD